MRNTLQEQYNLIKEGKGNKQHFFKSVRQLFPNLVTPINTYEDTVRILKNRGIITEGIGGVVTKGKTPDWHSIFKENINSLFEEKEPKKGDKVEVNGEKGTVVAAYSERGANFEQYDIKLDSGKEKKGLQAKDLKILSEVKEAKAEEKETTKEVTDMATRGYDYKDEKNYDNIFGQEFLKGYYTEMKDPKNEGKHVEELRQIVAKNLAKDINHYVKDGQFGIKGVGYTTEAPGLGTPKEAKGKHKSSGYGDLKESVLRSQIYLLVKEVLSEAKAKFNVGDIVTYKGEEYKITRFIDDRIYIKSLTHGGRLDSWVTASDLEKAALTEDNEYEIREGDIVKYKKEYAKSDTHFMITKDLGDTVIMRKVDAQGEPVGPFIPQVGKVQLEPVDIEIQQRLATGDLD